MALLDRMHDAITAWEQTDDRRAVFLSCYRIMTENMFAAIDANSFHDGPWVRTLLHRFAEYYFAGLDAYERPSGTPPLPWRIAHDAASDPSTMTVQNLFLGINAHVNYDLALTLVDVLDDEWESMPQARRRERHEDYCTVNDVIAATIDRVQHEVVARYTPALGIIDTLLGHTDEWALAHLVSHWRDQVWLLGTALLDTPRGSEQRRHITDLIEAMAAQRAEAVLLTGGIASLKTLW